jgi:hypothetical protein
MAEFEIEKDMNLILFFSCFFLSLSIFCNALLSDIALPHTSTNSNVSLIGLVGQEQSNTGQVSDSTYPCKDGNVECAC